MFNVADQNQYNFETQKSDLPKPKLTCHRSIRTPHPTYSAVTQKEQEIQQLEKQTACFSEFGASIENNEYLNTA